MGIFKFLFKIVGVELLVKVMVDFKMDCPSFNKEIPIFFCFFNSDEESQCLAFAYAESLIDHNWHYNFFYF